MARTKFANNFNLRNPFNASEAVHKARGGKNLASIEAKHTAIRLADREAIYQEQHDQEIAEGAVRDFKKGALKKAIGIGVAATALAAGTILVESRQDTDRPYQTGNPDAVTTVSMPDSPNYHVEVDEPQDGSISSTP